MSHILNITELKGDYKVIIASSSKEQKQLFICTTIDNGGYFTTFDVVTKNKTYPFSVLEEAIEYYNSITK